MIGVIRLDERMAMFHYTMLRTTIRKLYLFTEKHNYRHDKAGHISIHTLHAEGDHTGQMLEVYKIISIHALHAEGDTPKFSRTRTL